MDELSSVNIIMATKNGEEYLEEQILSIIPQSWPNWSLWIRDDNSRDNTLSIVNKYLEIDSRIHFLPINVSTNGAASAFWDALLNIPSDAAYYAFCDQDDVWLPNHIESLLSAIKYVESREGASRPCLVHGDLVVTDKYLNPLAHSFFKYQKLNPQYRNCIKDLMVQNHVTGCACLFNSALMDKLRIGKKPSTILMHDWWVALVAATFGSIVTLDFPVTKYRQHSKNDTGAKESSFCGLFFEFIKSPLITLKLKRASLLATTMQAKAFLEIYGDKIKSDDLSTFSRYSKIMKLGFWCRKWEILSLKLKKSRCLTTFVMLLIF